MKRYLCSLVALGLLQGVAGQLKAQPTYAFTTFDVPGSTGTAGFAINPAGTVTGVFFDAAGGMHGFLFFTIL